MDLFEDTDNNPDISVWISSLLTDENKNIILLQEDSIAKLIDINESLINESLNKIEAIYRLIDEVPELFIKINNAISLDTTVSILRLNILELNEHLQILQKN